MTKAYEVSFEGSEPRVTVEAKNVLEAIKKVAERFPKAEIRSIFPATIGEVIR